MDLGNSNIEPEIPKKDPVEKRSRTWSTPPSSHQVMSHLTPRQQQSAGTDLIPMARFTPSFASSTTTIQVPDQPRYRKRFPQIFLIVGRVIAQAASAAARAGSSLLGASGNWASRVGNNAAKTGKAYQSSKAGANRRSKAVQRVGKDTKPATKSNQFTKQMTKVLKHKSFKDYLAIAAVATVGEITFHTGPEITPRWFQTRRASHDSDRLHG